MKNTLEKQDFETSQIPNELILDSDLSTKALRIWMLIYLKPNDWKFSIDDLARDFKEETELNSLVTELEKRGYLRKNTSRSFELSAISYEREQDLEKYWDFAYEPLSSFVLSGRIRTCFLEENIIYLGELLERTERNLLVTANLGKKSVNEIKEFLAQKGLQLGTKIPFFVLKKIKSLKEKPLSTFPRFIKDRFSKLTAKDPIYIDWWSIEQNFVFPNCITETDKINKIEGCFDELKESGIIASWKKRQSDSGSLWGFYLLISDNFVVEIKEESKRKN